MLRIWGRLTSLNVRKVVWAAQELGLDFERTNAGREYGVVQTAAYGELNPNRLVPVIDDDGFRLWESNVIVRYFGAKYGRSGFYPQGLRERFDAERWMDWQQTTLNPAGRDAFVQLIRTAPADRNESAIAASVAATQPLLALLNEHLSRSEFLLGERFSMADIPVGCELHRWLGLPLEPLVLPHLQRYYAALAERSAVRGVFDLKLA
ncbi:MAG: hypothetical protein RL685_6597 [Pseudomonadota bacterium]|jgi:glutathione S-transferase